MAYIGREPIVGNFQKCDAITTSGTTTFNLLVSSVAVFPESANHCIVSLNGVIQAPTSAFTISGSTIIFNSALTSADVIDFVILLGNVLDLGVPSDDTVSTAKIADNAITLAKLAGGTDGNIISYDASGDPVAVATGSSGQILTSAGAGAVPSFQSAAGGGKILQVVSATDGSTRTTTSTSFVTASTTLTLNITPAATSSTILIMVAGVGQMGTTAGFGSYYTIFKGGSNIVGNEGMVCIGVGEHGAGYVFSSMDIKYIDSPSTTSAVTYDVRVRSENGSEAVIGAGGAGATDSIIIAMEIGA